MCVIMAVLQQVIIFALTSLIYATWARVPVKNHNVGIIGGDVIYVKAAPFVAALYDDGNVYGAGSIIHKQFILTSAKIVNEIQNFTVVVGSDYIYNTNPEGFFIEVKEKLCYGNNARDENNNDICLLKLKEPVPLGAPGNKVGIVDLPTENSELEVGKIVKVTGYGMMDNGRYSTDLRQAKVALLPLEDCRSYHNGVTDNMLCAGGKLKDACWGDRGAPMTDNNVLVGIVSVGDFHKCGRFPTIYTKVSKYITWINTTISNNYP